jgi:hypothetical protein
MPNRRAAVQGLAKAPATRTSQAGGK